MVNPVSDHSSAYLGTEQDVIMARVGAFIVDHVLSFIAALILGFAIGVSTRSLGFIYLGVFAGLIGYFIVLEAWSGQTIGKWLFGLIVVSEDGSPISLGQSVIRNLLRFIDGILYYAVGFVAMLMSEERQRIGDRVAGTVVVPAKP